MSFRCLTNCENTSTLWRIREQLVQGFGEGRELGARGGAGVLHQAGVAAREPQPREVREDLQPAVALA